MKITTVKEELTDGVLTGYKVNGDIFFSKENCELIKQWIAEGNTPEPEFTEEELASLTISSSNAEAISSLNSSDWKVIRELERLLLAGTELNAEREALRATVI